MQNKIEKIIEKIFFPKRYMARKVLGIVWNVHRAFEKAYYKGVRSAEQLAAVEIFKNEIENLLIKFLK